MFSLAGSAFPRNGQELSEAIRGALADVFTLPRNGQAVQVAGGDYPSVGELRIDLDGATVIAAGPPPKPEPAGGRQEGITVGQLQVSGRPIRYANSKLDLQLQAKDVKLDFAKDKGGHPLLVLSDAREGQAEAEIAKEDIRSLVTALAGEAAKPHGVTIEDVQINLTSSGRRSVAADVRVQAKKAVVKGVIHLKGRADLDDELNAAISDLSCTGEGIIGKVAAGFLQGKITEYNGMRVPLMAFSLGDVTLRDIAIDTNDGLHVTARFGSSR